MIIYIVHATDGINGPTVWYKANKADAIALCEQVSKMPRYGLLSTWVMRVKCGNSKKEILKLVEAATAHGGGIVKFPGYQSPFPGFIDRVYELPSLDERGTDKDRENISWYMTSGEDK